MDKNLILVDASVLPGVFSRVLHAKKKLRTGDAKTIHEAVKMAGISRSAYYKYKDYVFPFSDMRGILTLFFELPDIPGILSSILNVLAELKYNILTINQNIPVNGVANITISLQMDGAKCSVDGLLGRLGEIKDIKSIDVLAKQ